MSEPVIDIRDRIEKMRNQMSGPEGSSNKKSSVNKSSTLDPNKHKSSNKVQEHVNDNEELVSNLKEVSKKSLSEDITKKKKDFKDNFDKIESLSKVQIERIEKNHNFDSNNFKNYSSEKHEKVYKNESQSVKTDDETSFPQFSLNVSNPISWKLMLLIMVMQLLTNIMLVVVLYLK